MAAWAHRPGFREPQILLRRVRGRTIRIPLACWVVGQPVLPVIRSRGGAPVLVVGEQGEERADPEAFLGWVPELAVVSDGVAGAPPGAVAADVTGGLQVGHDGLDGAFGSSPAAALMSRIRASGLRAISTSTCPCPVRSVQLPPLWSGSLMPHDHNSRENPHARTHEIYRAFLLTAVCLGLILVMP